MRSIAASIRSWSGASEPIRQYGAVVLLAEPGVEPDRRPLEAVAPLVEPGVAAERRSRRERVHPDHAHGVLAQLADRDAAADVVDVVGVAVVAGVHRDDRPEMGRAELGDLDRREASVRDPPHPDVAVAPWLGRQPLDRVVAVLGLAGRVLVLGDARAAAGPTDIDPAQDEAARGQPAPPALVTGAPPVVLAVRQELEDHREPLVRNGGAGDGAPEIGAQLEAVVHRDPDVELDRDVVDRLGGGASVVGHRPSLRSGPHGRSPVPGGGPPARAGSARRSAAARQAARLPSGPWPTRPTRP